MKRLIVNADDFGLTSGVNRAVIECYLAGAVTSTTLLVNGQAAVEAALEAADNPGLGVGLHLNLSAGPPTADAGKVSSLLGPDGNFPGIRQALWRLTTGRARAHELESEIVAQVERLRELGIRPTHIDSHHHLHAHPRLRSLIKRTCPRLGITRMRGYHMPLKSPKALAVAMASRLPAPGNAMQTPAAFSGIEVMGSINLAAELERRLAREGDALEFMCHPGYTDEALSRASSYNEPRQTELDSLLSDDFAAAIERSGAQLVSFAAL
ncbi:MAG: carbohydrate deacetylase [Thermoleophilia bacterium]